MRPIIQRSFVRPRGGRFRACLGATLLLAILASESLSAQTIDDLHAIIEIGSSGVRGTVYQMTPDRARKIEAMFGTRSNQEPIKYKALKDAEKESYAEVETNVATDENNIGRTVDETAKLMERMRAEHAVPADRIKVVASSGVANAKHYDKLDEEFARRAVSIEKIDAGTECKLTFRWIVPRYRYNEVVVVDIGSGNTKSCYVLPGQGKTPQIVSFELSRFGTKTFATEVMKTYRAAVEDWSRNKAQVLTKVWPEPKLIEIAERLRRTMLAPALDRVSASYPGLSGSDRIYWVGGLPYATAALVRPATIGNDWVQIAAADFQKLRQRAVMENAFAVNATGLLPEKEKIAQQTAERIKKSIFNKEQILAGTTLALAIAETLGSLDKDANFFANVARDGWRSQLLLETVAAR